MQKKKSVAVSLGSISATECVFDQREAKVFWCQKGGGIIFCDANTMQHRGQRAFPQAA